MPVDLILKYFPDIKEQQIEQFRKMIILYREWNDKINVISRKDADNIVERHILHSLAIPKAMLFKPNEHVVDVGTGGGFPGIPLAVFYPCNTFTLIDSIGKKIKVVNEVAKGLELSNVKCSQVRSENLKQKYNYIVSRAVTNLPSFYKLTRHLLIKNGSVLYLKGGDFTSEINVMNKKIKLINIADYFEEEFFETKKVVIIRN